MASASDDIRMTASVTGSSAARGLIMTLKAGIDGELRAYPYPITACDVAFKLLAEQREQCRIALAGLDGHDGLDADDAGMAIAALLATPLAIEPEQRAVLEALAQALGADAVA